jgi:hypothetical protein
VMAKHTKFSQSSYAHHKWPKQQAFLEAKPKQFFTLVVTSFFQAWPLYFPCLHLGRVVSIQMDGRQFKQDIPIERNWQELDIL